MENVFKKLNDDLKAAMKSGDKLRLETIRMMKSKVMLINARGDLPDEEIIKILSKYAKLLKQSIEEYKKISRDDEVAQFSKELKIVEEYLPKQLSEDEVAGLVQKAIEGLGASTKKDMGKVIKKVISDNAGADGSMVSKIASSILK